MSVAALAGPLGPFPIKGGIEYQGPEVRAMQADEFGNPALFWVDRGAALWKEPRGAAHVACASCHGADGASMKGVAASYPRYSPDIGRVVDLEQRIGACIEKNQKAPAPAPESQELLSLSAFVARQSRGMPIAADPSPQAEAAYQHGLELYIQRQGQLNLACTNCHDQSAGRTLLAETVSQGQPADWPAYRLEWQALGSLERRLRACYLGVRAQMPDYGSPDLVALEVYLARRAKGLVTSPPGVRR